MTSSAICGGDGLFLGMCAHLSSEFDVIGSRIASLVEQEIGESKVTSCMTSTFHYLTGSHENIGKFSPAQNDVLLFELSKIVADHNRLIGMCEKMSRCLWSNVLVHYITSAFITCVCCLMILLAEGAAKLVFLNYIVASTTQVFVYSYGGNMLEDASTGIRHAAYSFEWYKCDNRVRELIQMIVMRAQRKSAVNVPFFDVSLETMASVSSASL